MNNSNPKRKNIFFKVDNSSDTYFTSNLQIMKKYIYFFIVVAIAFEFFFLTSFNLDSFKIGIYNSLFFSLSFIASSYFLINMINNTRYFSTNLNKYWKWILVCTFNIIIITIMNYLILNSGTKFELSNLILAAFIYLQNVLFWKAVFWIWLFYKGRQGYPLIKVEIKVRLELIAVSMVFILIAFLFFYFGALNDLKTFFTNINFWVMVLITLGILAFLWLAITIFRDWISSVNKIYKPISLFQNAKNILGLSILISMSIWYTFFNKTLNNKDHFVQWDALIIFLDVIIFILFILIMHFGKFELSSSLFRNGALIFCLTFIWSCFLFLVLIGTNDNWSYVALGSTGLTSALLCWVWLLKNTKSGVFFRIYLNSMVGLIITFLSTYAVLENFDIGFILEFINFSKLLAITITCFSIVALFIYSFLIRRIIAKVVKIEKQKKKRGIDNVWKKRTN